MLFEREWIIIVIIPRIIKLAVHKEPCQFFLIALAPPISNHILVSLFSNRNWPAGSIVRILRTIPAANPNTTHCNTRWAQCSITTCQFLLHLYSQHSLFGIIICFARSRLSCCFFNCACCLRQQLEHSIASQSANVFSHTLLRGLDTLYVLRILHTVCFYIYFQRTTNTNT